MPSYITHTDPPIQLDWWSEAQGELRLHHVKFGLKKIYEGYDEREATRTYDDVVKHYEGRKAAFAAGGKEAEGKVTWQSR